MLGFGLLISPVSTLTINIIFIYILFGDLKYQNTYSENLHSIPRLPPIFKNMSRSINLPVTIKGYIFICAYI